MRAPTAVAVAPPMPVSISSKISAVRSRAPASTTTSASSTRESSPPEPTRASGRSGSPLLAAKTNSIGSNETSKRAERERKRAELLARSPPCRRSAAASRIARRRASSAASAASASRSAACELRRSLVARIECVDDRARLLLASQHRFDRAAVLALETIEQIETRVDRLELGRIEFGRIELRAQSAWQDRSSHSAAPRPCPPSRADRTRCRRCRAALRPPRRARPSRSRRRRRAPRARCAAPRRCARRCRGSAAAR